MREKKALFCGEVSGHYYFMHNYYSDSGIIALLLLMRIILEKKKPLSKLIKPYKKYFVSWEKNFEVKNLNKVIDIISADFKGGKRLLLDGLRVDYKKWWFSVRPSANEPLLRLIVGATTKKVLLDKSKKLKEIIIKNKNVI